MKKLVIFDFDGTLFDSLNDVAKCCNQTFKKLGYPTRDLDFYIKSLGGNINEIVSTVLEDDNTPENIKKFRNTYERIYTLDNKENTKLFPGILELLEELQENDYILAINSNRGKDSISKFLIKEASNIEFICIQGHVDSKPSKPDPYGVNLIIKKVNVEKDECIYIGDSKFDVQTSKNAGIDCILVEWGYGVGNIYEDPYILKSVKSPDEILELISK